MLFKLWTDLKEENSKISVQQFLNMVGGDFTDDVEQVESTIDQLVILAKIILNYSNENENEGSWFFWFTKEK